MMNYSLDIKAAMLSSFQLAQDEANGIHAIETRVKTETGVDFDETSRLMSDIFIDGCKDVAMGLIHWR